MCKAVIGSEGPSCLAHWMDSPRPVEGVIFVQGRSNLMTSRPWRSETDETAERMMCLAGSNTLRFVTVNSPRRATHQKHTAMHAKIAASRGWSRDSICLRDVMMSVVKGARRGRLEEGGASLVAPSRHRFRVSGSTSHGWPWSMCQAHRPAA